MEHKLFAVFLAIIVLAAVVEAQRANLRNRGGRPRLPLQLPDGDVYGWSRNVSNIGLQETAFVPTGSNTIIVRSFDRDLEKVNLSRASVLYDFSSDNPLVAIGSFGPCFITNTNLTYQNVIDELLARNGSSVETTALLRLDGTSPPLSRAQEQEFTERYPTLRRVCRDGIIILTTPDQSTPLVFETEELNVLAVDSEVIIRIPQRRHRPTRPPVNQGTNRFSGTDSRGRFGPGRRPEFDAPTTTTVSTTTEETTNGLPLQPLP